MSQSLSLKEYYLWQKKVEKQYPWQRQYLNYEFLNYEEKRIHELSEWNDKFKKSKINSKLESAPFYVKPVGLNSSWKAAIADYGNFNYFGLSALSNSPSLLIVGLHSKNLNQPIEHRLIDITQSKRINLINKMKNIVVPALLIEEWDYLKSDSIYVDVPYEKKIISNLIKENLIDDEQISLCYQSPIISAPFGGVVGGVSFTSIYDDSSFAKELSKTMQMMVPPEYRTSPPPKSVVKGSNFQLLDGIDFHLAERPHSEDNILSSIYTNQYRKVDRELALRDGFRGEYSVFSAIKPSEDNEDQLLKELWKNFTAAEITLPSKHKDLLESGVIITGLKKMIDDNLWMQIVHSRQICPEINEKIELKLVKTFNDLKKHFDIILSDTEIHSESRKFLVDKFGAKSKDNLLRIAQSFARAEEKNQLHNQNLKLAADLIKENFDSLSHLLKVNTFKSKIQRKKKIENPRYSIVQTEIINNAHSTTSEIFEEIKSTKIFKDVYELQEYLDQLHENGVVIVDNKKGYVWV
ncbi:MAG: hypothetical protein OIN89_09285 [Candidatus Methanoperedens sp.]|jgi:hypothetical protein|nr:hypothetical protein [Candidatus Methanoperedens sp.]PKL52864.1 MAG: hypothetical protein CVV36_10195 [Candidatus Methanoperedenaceae archaeon HGW-Methanoperedenaceae-1]